ncbi:MAG: 3'(2'),5'-bisphosphate nucleotidase CysQ [Albidovulum sp.]|nr:3'(2'),5'-bisphosphate nucleotidase CysQ [Albidovulum sp.]
MDFDRLEKVLLDLALEAGNRIAEIRNSAGLDSRKKADGSMVTEADKAADELLRSGLLESFPGIPVVSEECAESHATDSEEFFIVDPLDGTRNFARGSSEFTVNVALVRSGVAIRGVVYAPDYDQMFHTSSDGFAIETRAASSSNAKLTKCLARDAAPPFKVVASRSARKSANVESFLAMIGASSLHFANSSIKFCMLARGDFDFYPRFGPTMEWDTAAGHAILSAAGGKVVRFDDGDTLIYGKPGYSNPAFVAASSERAMREFARVSN